jgi:hypothetical protein
MTRAEFMRVGNLQGEYSYVAHEQIFQEIKVVM